MSRSSGTTRRRRRHGQPAVCEAKRYAICGIENHGFRGVTNGSKKAASNAKSTVLSCGVFSIWVFGNFAPIFLNRESYMVMLTEGYGAEYAATLNTYMPMWIAPILLVACFVFGLVGGVIGKAICKKHFQRAGIA